MVGLFRLGGIPNHFVSEAIIPPYHLVPSVVPKLCFYHRWPRSWHGGGEKIQVFLCNRRFVPLGFGTLHKRRKCGRGISNGFPVVISEASERCLDLSGVPSHLFALHVSVETWDSLGNVWRLFVLVSYLFWSQLKTNIKYYICFKYIPCMMWMRPLLNSHEGISDFPICQYFNT